MMILLPPVDLGREAEFADIEGGLDRRVAGAGALRDLVDAQVFALGVAHIEADRGVEAILPKQKDRSDIRSEIVGPVALGVEG